MGKHNLPDFIVIDDDFINNVICQTIIQNELPGTKIEIFTNPKKGVEYIDQTYTHLWPHNAILLLDINMPALNGWDVLEQLRNSADKARQHLKIFILSSSLTPEDKQKAAEDPMVSGYIEKPLKLTDIQNIIGE